MELHAQTRTVFGKQTKCLRREGLIPAELYGHGVGNRHLAVNEKSFEKIYGAVGEHSIVTIVTEKNERVPVIIAAAPKNPMSQKYIAIDFHQIRMDEKIRTKIPIEFTGVAPATKKGLILVKVMNEIEIEALPQNLPPKITVTLESLEDSHQNIHVKDLNLGHAVKIMVPGDAVIATVTERKEETPETVAEKTPDETVPTTETTERKTEQKSA